MNETEENRRNKPAFLYTFTAQASASADNGEAIGCEMATGSVKWFNGEKGYGFIAPDAGGPDVFLHASAVEQAGMRPPVEGQKLEYEVVADRRTGKSSAGNLRSA